MNPAFLAQASERIGAPVLGIVIPAVIFLVSFLVAFFLFIHFSRIKREE